MPARSGGRRRRCSRVTASGTTDLGGAVKRAATRLGRRGCVALISDLYDDGDVQPALREARRMGHEVAVFHVLTPEERQLSPRGDVEFVDLETGTHLVANTPAIVDEYAARVAHFIEQARAFAVAEGIAFVEAGTSSPIDVVLRTFTQQRAFQAGGSR